MTKKKVVKPTNNLVSGELLKDVQACRPLRLFIKKQKKKGVESTPFALRAEFLQTSPEKQVKYFQKAIDKYIQLLDEKDIDEHVQIEGQLFENLLSKREQKMYFDSLDAPKKPLKFFFKGMTKKKVVKPTNSLVSGELLKDVQACRPLRLFIKKQKKKGVESTPFALRAEFLQTSPEKQVKYFQKAIDKYIQLLDEKDIDEHVQIEGQLFENLLSKREQKMYFDSLDAPKKPLK
ncbi:unnamed protein product [Adineta steineri]|uniref:Uncharacterized protein n=1 Tax=Adineta steineri TaxID=433720 RepID=A0A814GR37_9BILA|nr:unnamed protein product [Adineta steineri]